MLSLPKPITRIEQYLYAIASNEEEIRKQALLTQYVAAMADIYIPEEDAYVQDTDTTADVLPKK
jgi:hypothetical protein